MRVYLTTLGCKLNQSESERLARDFVAAGYQIALDPRDADLCVVNTCTVTHEATRKSRQITRRVLRANPQSVVVVTGCAAEIQPEEFRRINGVELVVGNSGKERLVRLVQELGIEQPEPVSADVGIPALPGFQQPVPSSYTNARSRGSGFSQGKVLSHERGQAPLHVTATLTRAFVKIQDGCNNRCTFCIITLARGRERSRPIHEIVEEINGLVQTGCQEVVLTGVHVGSYGHDLGTDLGQLTKAILERTSLPRLRLSSVEPWDFPPSYLPLWENPRLCRHLHLPLQSGCDETLRRMGRRYTVKDFCSLLEIARQAIPGVAITTDVMVGFPGESEAEFADSLCTVEEIGFARIHVFPYSPRPGTRAALMPGQVHPQVKQRRGRIMRDVARRSERAFQTDLLGKRLPVLWERRVRRDASGHQVWSGLTDNYVRVTTECEANLANRILPTKLINVVNGSMYGVLSSDSPP